MKKIFAALLALLMLLSGCAAKQEPEASPTPNAPEGMELSESTLRRREDIHTLLICAVAYDEEGNSTLTSLNVLVRDAGGEVAMLTIPKDTRVWVEQYDSDGSSLYCNYGPICDVYHAAEPAGLAQSKTVEAVSSLLGGVRIDHCVLLNVVQLQQLTELTKGVMLTVEDPIVERGIRAGFQDITPNIQEYASYSYLNNIGGVNYAGTDIYKLQRHQQLIQTILRVLARRVQRAEDPQAYAQQIIRCVTTDLAVEDLMIWIGRDTPSFTDTEILAGRHNERLNESYWIADKDALKDWVIGHFYLAEEE